MIDRRTCLAALSLSFASTPSFASNESAGLDDELETLRTKYGLPALAAAVVEQGKIVASGATGVRAHGSTIKVMITHRFHIDSDTKAFTATLAGVAVDEGKLQ